MFFLQNRNVASVCDTLSPAKYCVASLLATCCLMGMAGCGQTGDLYLPQHKTAPSSLPQDKQADTAQTNTSSTHSAQENK